MRELHTTDEVIDALGGTKAVSELMGCLPTAVSAWRGKAKTGRGKFPPDTYIVIREALRARGMDAPSLLWGMKEPLPVTVSAPLQGAAQ